MNRRFTLFLTMLLCCSRAEVALGGDGAATRTIFSFGLGGGMAQTSTHDTAYAAGQGDLMLGFVADSGLILGVVAQSLELERVAATHVRYDGTAGGIRAGYMHRRVAVWSSALLGSLRGGNTDADDDHPREHYDLATADIGIGFALYRSDRLKVELTGALAPIWLGAGPGDGGLGKRIWREQAGLALTFRPGADAIGDTLFSGGLQCYNCGELIVRSGEVLLRGGALAGQAIAKGIVTGLLRLH